MNPNGTKNAPFPKKSNTIIERTTNRKLPFTGTLITDLGKNHPMY